MKQKTPSKWLLGAVFGTALLLTLAVILAGCAGEPGPVPTVAGQGLVFV